MTSILDRPQVTLILNLVFLNQLNDPRARTINDLRTRIRILSEIITRCERESELLKANNDLLYARIKILEKRSLKDIIVQKCSDAFQQIFREYPPNRVLQILTKMAIIYSIYDIYSKKSSQR